MENNRYQFTKDISVDMMYEIATTIVSRYIIRSVIPGREKDDVVMDIVEKFINQKETIDKSFRGKSKISTYYIAVMNRMCCEIIRKESKHWYSVNSMPHENTKHEKGHNLNSCETENKIAIKDETKRLANTILFFNGQSAKTLLFLKYYFNIPVSDNDILNYSGLISQDIRDIFYKRDRIPKSILFENLARVVNIVEEKSVKGDAVRMWLNKQIDIILNRLNMYNVSNHSMESLKTLMEIQYSSCLSKKAKKA